VQKPFPIVLFGVLLAAYSLLAQTSHRQPNPQPPKEPSDIFKQLEKEKSEPAKERPSHAVATQQRSAQVAEVERELSQLVELAQGLQTRLTASDLEATLPVDLQRQAKELQRLAGRIHKQIGSL
jgi:hypothetical protein